MGNKPRGRPASVLAALAKECPSKVKQVMQELLNEHAQNRTLAADAMGVSRPTFYKVAAEVGLELSPASNKLNITRAGLLALLVASRGCRAAVAEQMGVSPSTVHRWIKRHKLETIAPASSDPYWTTFND